MSLSLSPRSDEKSSERKSRQRQAQKRRIYPKPTGDVSAFKMSSRDSIDKLEIIIDESKNQFRNREKQIKKAIKKAYSRISKSS